VTSWRHDGRSPPPDLDIDPLTRTAVRVVPRPGTPTADPPRMGWRATQKEFEHGSIEGAWIEVDGDPVAVFDLARSEAWLLGGTIRRIWFENQLRTIATAELLRELPVSGALSHEWVAADVESRTTFRLPATSQPQTLHGAAEWHLIKLEGHWGEDARSARGEPVGEDTWRFGFFDPFLRTCFPPAPTGVLECRVGDAVVARFQSE
jgi:hypothetical protein